MTTLLWGEHNEKKKGLVYHVPATFKSCYNDNWGHGKKNQFFIQRYG